MKRQCPSFCFWPHLRRLIPIKGPLAVFPPLFRLCLGPQQNAGTVIAGEELTSQNTIKFDAKQLESQASPDIRSNAIHWSLLKMRVI